MGSNDQKERTTIFQQPGELVDDQDAAASEPIAGEDWGRGGTFQLTFRGGAGASGAKNPTSSREMASIKRLWKVIAARRQLKEIGRALEAKRKRQAKQASCEWEA